MKYTNQKFNWNFILIMYENMKLNKQGYGARSYFNFVWNKLKKMGSSLNLYLFGDLFQGNFYC